MLSEIRIVVLEQCHIKQISSIHFQELGVGLLTLLGPRFVEAMYQALLEKNWGFVAERDDEVVGFIFATQTEISLLRCLSIHSLLLFVINSFRSPEKFRSFVSAFRKMYLTGYGRATTPNDLAVELSQFAVKDRWKARGIGKSLINALEDRARARGARYVFTRTHNSALAKFYTDTRNAQELERVSLGVYDAVLMKWNISITEGSPGSLQGTVQSKPDAM